MASNGPSKCCVWGAGSTLPRESILPAHVVQNHRNADPRYPHMLLPGKQRSTSIFLRKKSRTCKDPTQVPGSYLVYFT